MGGAFQKVNLQRPFDVDKINIREDVYFTNAYIVDLPLDSTPSHVWNDVFEGKWKSSRHLWDRKVFVIGDKLRLVTPVDHFEDKLVWIEKMIEETNKTIDEYALLLEKQEERRIKEELQKLTSWEERARIEMIKDVLRKKST